MILRGRQSPLRTCDKCGAQRHWDYGRMISGRFICNDHDHFIAREVLNQAPLRTFKPVPFKKAKPFAPRDTYENAETALMTFLEDAYQVDAITLNERVFERRTTSVATTSSDASAGVYGAAWTGVYAYEMIGEGLRSGLMIARARSLLKAAADFLLTKIAGYPGRPGPFTSASFQWGGFEQAGAITATAGTYFVLTAASAGLALLYAYRIHGAAAYLDGARAAAWFCRSCQCTDMLPASYTSSDSGGASRLHLGGFCYSLANSGGGAASASNQFRLSGLMAAEFLGAYLTTVGDEVIGSPTTGVDFSFSREATVSTCIAEARQFWVTGAFDKAFGRQITGLSTVTPFDYYSAYPIGTGQWTSNSNLITGIAWAHALRAVRAIDGDTAQVVGAFDWLMSFSANPVNALPAKYSQKAFWDSTSGSYDPRFALALQMQTISNGGVANQEADATVYNLGATGLLAGLYSTRQQASFKGFKDALNMPRPRSQGGLEDGVNERLGLMGRCGLSLQPRAGAGTTRRRDVYAAAMVGLAYRQEPKAFTTRGHA